MPRSSGVTQNPATASQVTILIRTGTSGRSVFRGMECLSNQKLLIDLEMTWIQAFRAYFGVEVDPELYTVQRQALKPYIVNKHDLREKVRLFMADFKAPLCTFTVFLVSKKRALADAATTTKMAKQKAMEIKENLLKIVENTGLGRMPRVSNVPKRFKADPAPVVAMQASAERRSLSPRKRLPVPKKANNYRKSAPLPVRNPVANENNGDSMAWSTCVEPPTAIRFPAPKPQQYNNDSRTSNGSGHSQLEDCGIQYEDAKAQLSMKVHNQYSNTQLLRMRHELMQLKTTDIKGWSKWTLTAPITANLIRELLDI